MRTTTKTTLASLVMTGGLALTLAAPAQAAVPTDLCAEGTTFSVTADPSIDAALVSSVRDALTARGLVATDGDADLGAVLAPASQIVEGGDASVMAVSLSAGEMDATKAVEGADWARVLWTDGATPINSLVDSACGPQESAETPDVAPAETPAAAPLGAAAPAAPAAPAPAAARAAPAPAAPAAAPAAPAAAPAAPAAPAQATKAQSTAVKGAATSSVKAAAPAAPATSGTVEVGASTAKASVSVADKNCGDFSSQAEAQVFFTAHGGPAADPHRLDADDDGVACETYFGGEDEPSRAEARTINAGVPDAAGAHGLGLVGGILLALSGLGVAVRARRLS